MYFAFAFWLFMLNQILSSLLGADGELTGYAYILRVLGFGLIIVAIVDKNTARKHR